MKTTLLLDHCPREPAGWVVRGLLRVEGIAPAADQRRPLNLSLVLDRSGSMAGEKLAAARDAAAQLVTRLRPDDHISVVAYDDRVDTIVAPTAANDALALKRAINAIHPRGSTNLSGGWLQGREYVAARRAPSAINRVILLTDGLANVGIQEPAQLAGLTATAHEQGVQTTTIGFGEDYDEQLLRAMAEAGGGQTYYIESPDQAPAVFEHEIQGLLGVCAQNVTLQFKNVDGVLAIRHEYPVDAAQAGRILIGDVYAAEPKPLLFEIQLDNPPTNVEVQIATIVVSGVVIDGDRIEQQTVTLPILIDLRRGAFSEPAIEREVLLLAAARARQAALQARDRGDWDGARGILREARELLGASALDDVDLREEQRDMEMLAELHAPSAADLKYMFQRAHDTTRGTYGRKSLISREKP